MSKLPSSSLVNVYDAIEAKIATVSEYIKKWLQYQSLWDLHTDAIYAAIGEDLVKWQQLVNEIKRARGTFDNAETEKSFGSLVIDYDQVQTKVNAKYDQWQREILTKFGGHLGNSVKEFFGNLSKARTELEQRTVETSSTSDAVEFITFVQDLKKKLSKWTENVELYKISQKALERQRFVFPSDWLYVENVEGEWNAFNEILKRKSGAISEHTGKIIPILNSNN